VQYSKIVEGYICFPERRSSHSFLRQNVTSYLNDLQLKFRCLNNKFNARVVCCSRSCPHAVCPLELKIVSIYNQVQHKRYTFRPAAVSFSTRNQFRCIRCIMTLCENPAGRRRCAQSYHPSRSRELHRITYLLGLSILFLSTV
jgi:hypothetical protein